MTYGYFHHSGAVAIKTIKKTICKSVSIFVRLLVLPLALAETIKLLGREAMHYYYEKVCSAGCVRRSSPLSAEPATDCIAEQPTRLDC